MTLKEEIVIMQFGQGIHSEADLLNRFSKLSEDEKRWRIIGFRSLLDWVKPTESEVAQFNSPTAPDTPQDSLLIMYTQWTQKRELHLNLPKDGLDEFWRILLNLFKAAYQQTFEAEKDNPDM